MEYIIHVKNSVLADKLRLAKIHGEMKGGAQWEPSPQFNLDNIRITPMSILSKLK